MEMRTPAQTNRTPRWKLAIFYLTAGSLALFGLAMLAGGIALARFGGSIYYLIAGAAMVISAVLILMRRRLGFWLYWAVVGGSIIWAVWEVGFHPWLLLPRLLVLTLFGLWLLLPWMQAPSQKDNAGRSPGLIILAGAFVACLTGHLAHTAFGPATNVDPRYQAGEGSFPAASLVSPAEDADAAD